jgi:hypothetical protein
MSNKERVYVCVCGANPINQLHKAEAHSIPLMADTHVHNTELILTGVG